MTKDLANIDQTKMALDSLFAEYKALNLAIKQLLVHYNRMNGRPDDADVPPYGKF